MLFVNVVEERLADLKHNIDFGERGQGTKGEDIEMSTMQKGCHFMEVCFSNTLYYFVPHCTVGKQILT